MPFPSHHGDVVAYDPPAALTAFLTGVGAAVEHAGRTIAAAARQITASMGRFTRHLTEAMNDPVIVAGLEARYLVAAGMDPAYATEADLHRLVVRILTGRAEDTALLTARNRSLVAAAAIRGWCS